MPLQSKKSLHEKLADEKFRDAFVSSRIGQTVAAQVRVLRQREGLSQKDLARELGTSQNAIYRLENPKYGKHNVSTLKKAAKYFKVGLVVRFAPLSEIVDWTLDLSERSINVPEFSNDPGFSDRKPVVSQYGEPQEQKIAVGDKPIANVLQFRPKLPETLPDGFAGVPTRQTMEGASL
jgi:transcriptional regulator with XRE-family HTH domain